MSAKNKILILAIWTVFDDIGWFSYQKSMFICSKWCEWDDLYCWWKKYHSKASYAKRASAYAFLKRRVSGLIYLSNDSVFKDDHVPVKKIILYFSTYAFLAPQSSKNSNFEHYWWTTCYISKWPSGFNKLKNGCKKGHMQIFFSIKK